MGKVQMSDGMANRLAAKRAAFSEFGRMEAGK